MFRFENIEYIYFFAAVLIVAASFMYYMMVKRSKLKRYFKDSVKESLSFSSLRNHWLKFALSLFVIVFAVIGILNPQWGTKREKAERKSIDVVIALDLSLSMLGNDISPSRLENAKVFTNDLIYKLRGDRIGVTIFGGNAYTLMPITSDFSAAQMFIASTNPNQIPAAGTSLGSAIEHSLGAFQGENDYHKAMIIISDGENHDRFALEMAEEAASSNTPIYTVGVGTEKGSLIPYKVQNVTRYKMDKSGKPVKTKLEKAILEDIATISNGKYFKLNDHDKVITQLKDELSNIESRSFEEREFSSYNSYFQYFIFIALLLLIIEWIIPFARKRNDTI